MEFRYKGFDVSVEKRSDGLFRWYAYSDDVTLGDREGGDLGTYKYAKSRIKKWIDEYLQDPQAFKRRYPELVLHEW
jgi:hypothetical protein